MKKIIFILLLLVAAGITVYYLGTIPVQPGMVSVVASGASGLLPEVLDTPGRHFRWQRLIPGDTEIYSYPLQSAALQEDLLFLLPPGELPVFGGRKEFEVRLRLELRITLTAKAPLLLAAAGFRTIDDYLKTLAGKRSALLRDALARHADQMIRRNQAPDLPGLLDQLNQDEFLKNAREQAALYALKIESMSVKGVLFPDPDNYLRIRQSLAAATPDLTLRLQQHYKSRAELEVTRLQNELELKRLIGIAGLVSKHPKILDYLAVMRLSDKLRIALLSPGNDNPLHGKLYREMVDKMLSRLPGAAPPVNVNVHTGTAPAAGTNTGKGK